MAKEKFTTKIEVLSRDTVKVTRQAYILGFVDYGSVTETVYASDKWENSKLIKEWRDVNTGEPAGLHLKIDIDRAVEAWEWLEKRKLDLATSKA